MKDTGIEFMERTKYIHLTPSHQSMGIPQPPLESEYDMTNLLIKLPEFDNDTHGESRFIDIVKSRRSCRQYAKTYLEIKELEYLLWCTQGIIKKASNHTLRTVPSAGARHAIDTYLQINKVNGLKPGIYRYLALENALIELDTSNNTADKMVMACLGQSFIKSSAVNFIWAADIARMYWRYGARGYRYVHLDAGHICQNLYLAAESINCGACAIAAFDDDAANQLLGLDGVDHFVVYIASTGKKKS